MPTLMQDTLTFQAIINSFMTECSKSILYFSDSKLTLLLKNELGGNCKTRGILCLKPASEQNTLAAILNFTTRFNQVKNFPIVNDSYAQVSD